ncbi:hypothetical protein [Streptomyces sp. GC420]|uniref:hypothetical protein n=1 Tax=Streptomyces sp. GC420 TaxID=2697568 RepID=UPI00141529C5|nr:hypothetical protein [Streptomyces sp. GC420]NBM17919.1 hypothetical protein [Streptomyces sp. GC420]
MAAWAAAAVLLTVPSVAACGDDGGGNEPAPSPTATTSAPAAPSEETGETQETASAPADPAAAEKEIKENWARFFDPDVSMEDKAEVLENGERLTPVLQAFSGDQRGQEVEATVTDVAFTSPTDADVTYDLALQGQTALPDAKGVSVLQDGVWKVSAKTLCALVRLSGNATPVPGC